MVMDECCIQSSALYCEAKPVPTQQLVYRSLHETFADVNLFPVCNCREKHNPAGTQKDCQLSRSMSDSACCRQLRVNSGLPVNQVLPVDRSTLRDHLGRFAQSNFELLSLRPCPQHKLGTLRLMRETRDSYPI
jgi:hypothetical protein